MADEKNVGIQIFLIIFFCGIMNNIFFSIILPAYNEAGNLENCANAAREALKDYNYEIIIAEDGSTDGTDKIAEKLAKVNKRIRFLHNNKKLGRGLALKNAFKIARGKKIGYIDVDMATDMKHLKELIEYSNDYDVVTGSRYLKISKTKRPLLRDAVSRVYNFLIRFLLGCKIYDSQCGFKAFSRRFVENEIFNIKEKSWAWDTAVLITAAKKGYKIKEFPVDWIEKKGRKHSASFGRIQKDIKIHGSMLIKLFMKYRLGMNIEI